MADSAKRMMGYLPMYWHDSLEMQQILQSQGVEIDERIADSDLIYTEAFIMSASEKRISEWEKRLKIHTVGTLEERRLEVLSYFSVVSKLDGEAIKTLVSVLLDGARCDPYLEDSTIVIIIYPLPENANNPLDLKLLRNQLEKKKPCHISLDIQRGYCSWQDVKDNISSWNLAKEKFNSWNEVKLYIPS